MGRSKRELATKAVLDVSGHHGNETQITFLEAMDFDGLSIFSIRLESATHRAFYFVSVDRYDLVKVDFERAVERREGPDLG